MRELLEEKYNTLREQCNLTVPMPGREINLVLKRIISAFLGQCEKPAIWCYGKHTKMLMSDFMFELKNVRYIIDNGIENKKDSGFEIIDESKIDEKKIDGVIISSRVYKDEIAENLRTHYGDIKYLDIYEELKKAGIHLKQEYYAKEHPYARYRKLNELQRNLVQITDDEAYRMELQKIIQIYVEIKDFRSAILYTEELIRMSCSGWEKELLRQLKDIYELQKVMLQKINKNNVVMLCVDGLRRKEVSKEFMPGLCCYIAKKTRYFRNAYSVSTSTYESLIPAYSENPDLRTGYYEENKIQGKNCRFICEAKRQKRKIVFYTDGTDYVEDEAVSVTAYPQSATEKLWEFLLDAIDEDNGLFYVHILYESHFSYPNPYTAEKLIGEGTHIFFDFLDKNGGEIQADYERQQKDSLRYLDDTVVPLIENLQCSMVLYADHGNILLGRGTDLNEIEKVKYTFHEDLLQVPFAISYPRIIPGEDGILISIMELNNILIALMNRKKYLPEKKEYIKVLRSEIYNPDFRYLYRKTGNEKGLLAFEVFIFEEGYKLAVYADGDTELYLKETDERIDDPRCKKRLLAKVRDKITVCDLSGLAAAAQVLCMEIEDLKDLPLLKKGMTNTSFLLKCKGKKYILRIPGKGTDRLISRREEAEVYQIIKRKDICDNVIYMDSESGYKITEYIEGARTCNPYDEHDVRICMKKLRQFHNMHLMVEHTFDVFHMIDFYESLRENIPSIYHDYEETKRNVRLLKAFIDSQEKENVLAHIDAVPDNFLIVDGKKGNEEVRLIDWEYAGMQDPHIDIAMFGIYSMYDREQVDNLIEIYFAAGCDDKTRVKIYCYVAACGLLWSNWCEYKQTLGVEFEEYALRQYQYAKEFCQLAANGIKKLDGK